MIPTGCGPGTEPAPAQAESNGKPDLKWIELIRVRSSAEALRQVLPALQAQVAGIDASNDGAETALLQHALYVGDLAVVVVWRTEDEPAKTREGLLVAERLQRLGAIDHAVWIPTAH